MTETTTADMFNLSKTPGGDGGRAAGLAGLLPARAGKGAQEPEGDAGGNENAASAALTVPAADPFEAAPLRRDQLTGTPEERLLMVEAALRRAKLTEMESVRAARVRGRIEAGAALALFVEDELHKTAGYASLDEYATDVLHMDRSAVYEYIKDGKRLALVAPLSSASERPLLPSQAKVLAPIVERDGEAKARQVLELAESRGKVTAASLTAAAKELEVDITPAEKAPRRSAPDPLDVIEAGLLALRQVREKLDKRTFRSGWETLAKDGAEAERLEQLRSDVAAEARAIGAAARWQPKASK
ncbi:hypothetical protein ACPXCP_39890 [Streptomyces sp. DT20]|uniref:hypothetical protein n=1 Tax=Streptomyces sp. DT20 TaxID=3416519 RepID=UPI003CF6195C